MLTIRILYSSSLYKRQTELIYFAIKTAAQLLRLVPTLAILLLISGEQNLAQSLLSGDGKDRLPVSLVGGNGMPRDIVKQRSIWNFGAGALQTHLGWQYAAYWDDARQVSVARRQLPDGIWETVSLPDYQRAEAGNRGKGGAISRGFGDGHEKVSMGISSDGHIHLSFDHHLSTLRYRVTKSPVAANPTAHTWSASLFGPVKDNLGGPKLDYVTYPSFTADGEKLVLYLRMGGGSGAANSHLFTYEAGRWFINTESSSQFINQHWSGGDGTVNAYPHGLVIQGGRWHVTWCWRDTPNVKTCHDLCYAYSEDSGKTWRNSEEEVIAVLGKRFITADSPSVAVWSIPTDSGYRNGGSMTVDHDGRVHVVAYGRRKRGIHFMRDPVTRKWSREDGRPLGKLIAGTDGALFLVNAEGIFRSQTDAHRAWVPVVAGWAEWFEDCKMCADVSRVGTDGWISVLGQQGKSIRVVDYKLQ